MEKRSSGNRDGFTLVELLVVIAIVAVLATVAEMEDDTDVFLLV